MGPETAWVEADQVRAGDRIARRNVCGGFVEWLGVTERLDAYGCIGCGDAVAVVTVPGERVEIAGDRS